MQFESHNVPVRDPKNGPVVTVFCAVWHKERNKENLLRSHWENLKAQGVPIEPCYIFDNGDQAPDWLDAPWYSFSEPLTIYEAWSAAVALCETPYIMNLNLDDRLATNAVRTLLGAAVATRATLIGGDWRVVFDTDHLEETFGTEDLYDTHYVPDWPPKPSQNMRLGSGSGERGTFGPATMWNVVALGKWYPSHFNNGEPIRSAGDSIFWYVLQSQKNVQMRRLPIIIGRYYSNPDVQGEFRPNNDRELMKTVGVSATSFAERILTGDIVDTTGTVQPAKASVPLANPSVQTATAPDPAKPHPATLNEAFADPSLRADSKSQLGQDIFAAQQTGFRRDGFFVEFGATDGVTLSNTWMLENRFGWNGILAEPAQMWHKKLSGNRSVDLDHRCVWTQSGARLDFVEAPEGEFSTLQDYASSDHHSGKRRGGRAYSVETVSLTDLLDQHQAPPVIDYLSIDTEGSEFDILEAFDFDRYNVRVITCEHNYTPQRDRIQRLLAAHGYQRLYETRSKWDDWYVKVA